MKNKTCSKCKKEKPLSEFYEKRTVKVKKDGSYVRETMCRTCQSEKNRLYHEANKERIRSHKRARFKTLYKDNVDGFRDREKAKHKRYLNNPANKEKIEARKKAHYEANKTHYLDYFKTWRKANIEKVTARKKAYNSSHKKETNERRMKRYYSDPVYRLKTNLGNSYRQALTKKGFSKKNRTHDVLGMSFADWRLHTQGLLEEEIRAKRMPQTTTLFDTVIDHIVPLSLAKTLEEVDALNHYSNLRPLLPEENGASGKWDKLDLSLVSPENKIRYKEIIERAQK